MNSKERDEALADCHRMLNNCDRMLLRQREAHDRLLRRVCTFCLLAWLPLTMCFAALGK